MQKYHLAVAFFVANAGYSYDPKTETEEQGKRRGARKLATAERRAWKEGCRFSWSVDPDIDSSDFSDERPPWSLYQCAMFAPDGRCVASLHGIDFGRDGFPSDGNTYRRVVEAELALEAYSRA